MPRTEFDFAVKTLLDAETATGEGDALGTLFDHKAFQVHGKTTAGAGAAQVKVWGSLDNVANHWVLLGTVDLVLGTTETADGFALFAPWRYVKGEVVSISGTGARVSLLMAGN